MPRARQRRALSQQTLDLRHEGPLGETLAQALTLPEQGADALTHRFHPYPGRFHPHLPRTVLEAVTEASSRVLDPFMGGGTSLVEALLLKRRAVGNDLNPVAGLVARERTRPRGPAETRQVLGEARRIAGVVESLRREKRPPRVRLRNFARIAPHYQQHLLAEMLQWIRLINELPRGPAWETLRAVFSASAVKYSNQPSDAEPGSDPPTYPKGAVSRFLLAKCEELLRAQEALWRATANAPPVELLGEDARLLPSLGWGEVDTILTSPPYPGVYDYHEQHRLRIEWLGLEGDAFARDEIGSRRAEATSRWNEAMGEVFTVLARVLRPGGSAYLVLADWVESSHAVDAAQALTRIAGRKGWKLGSHAAARREVFFRAEKKAFAKRGKWEHLLQFTR